MPLKRKAASALPGASPAKRLTRSSASVVEAAASEARVLRTSDKLDNATITPRPITKRYGGRASSRRTKQSVGSLKENEKEEEAEGSEEKSSEDELDMLSPTILAAKRAPKPSPMDITLGSPDLSAMTRTRSGKLLEKTDTPTRRQPKRGQAQSSAEITPLQSTPRPKGRKVLRGPDEATQTLPTRANTASLVKKIPQATSSKRTLSPNKKTFIAIKKVDVGQGAKRRFGEPFSSPDPEEDALPRQGAPSLQKQPTPEVQESTDEPSKQSKTTALSEGIFSPSRVSARRPASAATGRISTSLTSLKFDSVVIPPLAKPHRPTPLRKTVSRSGPPSVPLTPSSPLSSAEAPVLVAPPASPSKKKTTTLSSPTRLPRVLPRHLHTCLNAQKRAILQALQNPPELDDDNDVDEGGEGEEPSTNSIAAQQLTSLLAGTVSRGEGNSCLVLGPRGSGKSRLVERCISSVSGDNPLVLRLSGWTQHSDRLAMREIAYQLGQQTGTSFLPQTGDGTGDDSAADGQDEDENPFLDTPASSKMSLTPSSHLPALISVLPTLNRPTIVILDGFDLFALHPRQSLLYCLLDTAQSCRAAAGSKGLAVIGITNRIDTINGLEKRVKSRFSGRMLRTAPPRTIHAWEKVTKAILSSDIDEFIGGQTEVKKAVGEWQGMWDASVDQFLRDPAVQIVLNETFSVTRDVRMLSRILLSVVLRLSPASPSISSTQFASAAIAQRARPCFPLLHTLPYPHICLLIASIHADTAGHATFTFEMLHEYFRDQLRASTSAPVQLNGGSIGMVRCSSQVLMTAYEDLISTRVFVAAAAYAPSVAKEFVKYRSAVDREAVKKAVDRMNQVNLKKWLTKAQ